MYSAHQHGTMLTDQVRVGAYRRALQKVVKPGDVVVDIGAGSGIFSLFACQAGARKVYAIEPEEVIDLARLIAKDNGYADRIEFIRDLSTRVALPEKANVIVSDMHGGLPVFTTALESLIDARRRWLAPGGAMMPLRERIWAAVVELPVKDYDRVAVWQDRRYGVDLTAGGRFGVDTPFSATVTPEQFVTAPQCIATIEHLRLDSPSICGQASFTASRAGQANGFSLWFDNDLAEGVSITTAPGEPSTVYPNQFVPWSQPVSLNAGDSIHAEIRFAYVNEDYLWAWNTSVRTPDGTVRADFRQSSLNSTYVTSEQLRKRAPGYRPRLTPLGIAGQALLGLMDGRRTHEEVARMAFAQHPEAFPNEQAALKAVVEFSALYGQ
ncbi:MAG: 50S ribosomal protein L11 methyltransferase [Candidatus Korobacteraceae bacterium]